MNKAVFFSILFTIFPAVVLQGHGIHIDIKMDSPVVIASFGYSETQPLADGIVTVFSPSDAAKAYQTGRSDKSGKFVFLPDMEGEWTITVDDQKGHAEKEVIMIPAEFFIPGAVQQTVEAPAHDHDHAAEDMPVTWKIIIGLSLIFGITGLFYGYQAKRANK